MAGVYFEISRRTGTELTGYLRCGGYLSVLGLISISIEFYLAFTYRHKAGGGSEIWGQAIVTVSVKVALLQQERHPVGRAPVRRRRRRPDPRAGRSRLPTGRTTAWPSPRRAPHDHRAAGPVGGLAGGLRRRRLAQVSVFVAPRLRSDTGTTLARYPDFVDWPAIVGATTWQVTSGGDPDLAVDAEVAGAAPDCALWAALFPPDTRVTRTSSTTTPTGRWSPTGSGRSWTPLRSLYAEAAAVPPGRAARRRSGAGSGATDHRTGPPAHRAWWARDGRLWRVASDEEGREQVAALLADARRRSHARRPARRGGSHDRAHPGRGGPSTSGRCSSTRRPRTEPKRMPADGEHYRDLVDFHQMVGALGDHPDLLRRLGLVVDLRVPPTRCHPHRRRPPVWSGSCRPCRTCRRSSPAR